MYPYGWDILKDWNRKTSFKKWDCQFTSRAYFTTIHQGYVYWPDVFILCEVKIQHTSTPAPIYGPDQSWTIKSLFILWLFGTNIYYGVSFWTLQAWMYHCISTYQYLMSLLWKWHICHDVYLFIYLFIKSFVFM